MTGGYVYIMTNKPLGVLYTGVTADLASRVWQHKNGLGSKFCKRYNCDKLVFAEPHARIDEAIAREKAIKAWQRRWKLELISTANPNWDDLFEQLHACPNGSQSALAKTLPEIPASAGMTSALPTP